VSTRASGPAGRHGVGQWTRRRNRQAGVRDLVATVRHRGQLAHAAGDPGDTISDFKFSPATITIHVGDTITWTNNGPAPHTATANDHSFDTGTLNKGQSASHTFTTAGTFAYICAIHPFMHGTVVVAAAASTTPAPSAGSGSGSPASSGSTGTGTATATPAAATSSAPPLPVTGMNLTAMVVAAAVLIAVGIGLHRRARV
jgi:plastocyanin